MPRKPRPLDRNSVVVRDASLIVIASEDTNAVQQYFDRFQPRRVQFRVLPTNRGQSAPEYIVQRLDQFRKAFDLDDNDQLWYCGDTDHWVSGSHLANLVQVLTHCSQSKYHVALSHPCFEVWLLLHFIDAPADVENCEKVINHLSNAASGYSKSRGCVTAITTEMIETAIKRARGLDVGTSDIPKSTTTRIYKILELLIARESIQLKHP